MIDTHSRSITKALSWRVIATLTTMTVVFILTKEILLSLGVGAIEGSTKLMLYYLHERGWNKIKWGRKKKH